MNSPISASGAERTQAEPWWRVGMVWFALAGPAAVVVAGLVTAAIAVHGADPVLRVEASGATPQAPAVQARNHAAGAGPKE